MSRTMRIRQTFAIAALLSGAVLSVLAQTPAAPAVKAATPAPRKSNQPFSGTANGKALPVEINADRLEYDSDRRVLKAFQNVVIQQGDDVLHSDYAEFYKDTQDVIAQGHVHFDRNGSTWEGEKLKYNFVTQAGDFGEFNSYSEPFYIKATKSTQVSDRETRLSDATISTCEGDHPGFSVHSTSATITDGNTLHARNVVAFLGPVPIFYLPVWRQHLDSRDSGWDVVPGYSTAMGGYLLTAYNYRLTPVLRAATHFDYRSRRGVGVGQDFNWKNPQQYWEGEFKAYYINDQEPFEDSAEEAKRGNLISSDRYRLRLTQFVAINERDYLLADVNYLSDPDVLEDFFDNEFRHGGQPENRIALVHRGNRYSAGLEVDKRLNDFFESVDRLPEASVDIYRQPIPGTPLFYDGQDSAVYLNHLFPEEVAQGEHVKDSYDAFRVDSEHTLYYPTRNFGFLNVIPRAGYRATYYSKTRKQTTVTETVTDLDTNGLPIISVSTNHVTLAEPAELRNVFELGTETSYKGFKVLSDDPLWADFVGLRHVYEPFANYTYVPTPNLTPDQVYQFDDVDKLDARNDVRFGVRNKLQTKKKGNVVYDLVDATISTRYFIESDEKRDPNEDPDTKNDHLDTLDWDVELRPLEWLAVDFDGAYDVDDRFLDQFNTQIGLVALDESKIQLEYRYKKDKRDQIAPDLTLFPNARWSVDAYARYSLQDSLLEEEDYFVLHKTDCLGVGVGFRTVHRDEGKDDLQVWLQIYLLAFPHSSISLGR